MVSVHSYTCGACGKQREEDDRGLRYGFHYPAGWRRIYISLNGIFLPSAYEGCCNGCISELILKAAESLKLHWSSVSSPEMPLHARCEACKDTLPPTGKWIGVQLSGEHTNEWVGPEGGEFLEMPSVCSISCAVGFMKDVARLLVEKNEDREARDNRWRRPRSAAMEE